MGSSGDGVDLGVIGWLWAWAPAAAAVLPAVDRRASGLKLVVLAVTDGDGEEPPGGALRFASR